MGGVFYVVLNMSITGAVIGLLVMALRPLMRGRTPAWAACALWGLAGLRLVLPFSIPSRASLLTLIGSVTGHVVSAPAGDAGVTMTNSILAADAYFPMRFKTGTLESIFAAAGWAWLAGAALMAAALALLYALAALRLRRAEPSDSRLLEECAQRMRMRRVPGIYVSDAVSSPAVFGIFRPRILIPYALAGNRETLRYALLHELAHIRRRDNVLRALSALLLCAHWFNPLAWLFFLLAGRDMEAASDASALKRLNTGERKGYALALASLASGRQPLLAAAFGSTEARRRIIGVVKYRRVTLAAAVVTMLGLAALAVALLTNPG